MEDGTNSGGEAINCANFAAEYANESPDAIYEAFCDLDLSECTAADAITILRFLKRNCDVKVVTTRTAERALLRLRELQTKEDAIVPGRGIAEASSSEEEEYDDAREAPGGRQETPERREAAIPPRPRPSGEPNTDWPGRGALGQQLADAVQGRASGPATSPSGIKAPTALPSAAGGSKLLSGVLVGGERVAPSVVTQIDYFFHGSAHAFAAQRNWASPRNEREADNLVFIFDLLRLELGRGFVLESDAVEVLLRRLLAVTEADARGNWKFASELELAPRDRLIIPEGVRRAARKAADNRDDDGKKKKGAGAKNNKKKKGKQQDSSSGSDSE